MPPPTNNTNLFVAGLPSNVDDDAFKKMFERFGEVKSAKVMLDIHSGVSRGFGFILFKDMEHATEALQTMHGTTPPNGTQVLHVALSRHDGQCALMSTDKMYIRNLPLGVTKADITTFLSQFGVVESVSLRPDTQHTRAGTNVALVAFSDVAAVDKAVAAVHGHSPFPSCTIPLMAKPCEPTEHRQKRLAIVRGSNNSGNPNSGHSANHSNHSNSNSNTGQSANSVNYPPPQVAGKQLQLAPTTMPAAPQGMAVSQNPTGTPTMQIQYLQPMPPASNSVNKLPQFNVNATMPPPPPGMMMPAMGMPMQFMHPMAPGGGPYPAQYAPHHPMVAVQAQQQNDVPTYYVQSPPQGTGPAYGGPPPYQFGQQQMQPQPMMASIVVVEPAQLS